MMIKKISYSLLLLFALTALVSFLPERKTLSKTLIKTVIVDAGHGGRAPGAKGKYSYEKNVCLAIALKLGKKIEAEMPDVKVIYTRTTDVFVHNKDRATMANEHKGDLYVAIHANAVPKIAHRKFTGNKTQVYYTGKGKSRKKRTRKVPVYKTYYSDNPAHGTETYIWAADRTDEKGDFISERMSEGSEEEEYTPDINDPEFKAKSLLWTKRYFDKSLQLANMVEEEFRKGGRPSRGVKQRNDEGIWILQATAMPSILVETGFLSYRQDEDYLNNKNGQEEIADQILSAIKRYKAVAEGKK